MAHVGFAQTVAVRRIDKTDALIDGMMNDLDGGYFVGPCLRYRQRHAAETDGAHGQACIPQFTSLHGGSVA